MNATTGFKTLAEFYPYYLQEHSNRTCRRLHFVGSTLGLVLAFAAVLTQTGWLLAVALVQGYAWAWVGHFFFEHNKPATFKHPWLSFLGDWKMWWQMLTGKIPF
ncbi:hypothetical protein SAMN04488120_11016 [Fontimonas thermophila]|uniref:DUF962 domain-containing protein n=1 Tax=Fontimonas thermophila TaxID=1076937 RepID=A0A1I2JUY5_9GAMM|nr:DUF962 domain-containing protein [Fontimonas thermophila]SFF57878.1 hypothetical protein SAMN04488120_11016 [Fontimonas thermophila]